MCSFSPLSPFRANDGCLYVFDLEQNKRTLKVSASECNLLFCVWLVGLLVPLPESCPPPVPHPATKVRQTLANLKVFQAHIKFRTTLPVCNVAAECPAPPCSGTGGVKPLLPPPPMTPLCVEVSSWPPPSASSLSYALSHSVRPITSASVCLCFISDLVPFYHFFHSG